jgi:hypothetical protein
MMIKYAKLPLLFDAARMQQEVENLTHYSWKLHYNTKHYDGEWSALPLRSADGSLQNIIAHDSGAASFADTELMQFCPYIQWVTQQFKCPLLAIRLLKLKAGAVIHPHSDYGLYLEDGEIRLHIPIVTNELVAFFLEDERIYLRAGECWYMNLVLMHHINNKSEEDRIHLVMDMVVNDWVKELFNHPEIKVKKTFAGIIKKGEDEKSKRMTIKGLRLINTPTANELADKIEAELNYTHK